MGWGGYSGPRIGGNSLLSVSDGYAIKLSPARGSWAADVDATGNYWGTVDPLEIAARIYDGADAGPALDPEHYHPRVVAEWTQCPRDPMAGVGCAVGPDPQAELNFHPEHPCFRCGAIWYGAADTIDSVVEEL